MVVAQEKENSMKTIPVASSLLKSVGYDPEQEELRVVFHKGGSYVYRGVGRSSTP
jgi:hypothetical protein